MADEPSKPAGPESSSPSIPSDPKSQPAQPRTITLQISYPVDLGVAGFPFGDPAWAQPGGIYPPLMASVQSALMQTHWQGPFPPPDAVERFERVQTGSFNRILSMAEELQTAQIAQSEKALTLYHNDVSRAQWLALAGMLAAMAGAGFAIHSGHDIIAGIFLAMPVMGVVKALIDSARLQPQASGDALKTPAAETPPAGAAPDAPNPT